MGRYNFTSGGAMAGNAIEQFFVQRMLEERQRMTDAQRMKEGNAAIGQRDRSLDIEAEQNAARTAEREAALAEQVRAHEAAQAANIYQTAMPGVIDPAAVELTKKYGYALPTTQGQPMQGADLGVDEAGVNQYDVVPGLLETTGGFQYQQARAAEAARAAQAEDAQRAAAERAAADRDAANQRATDANATRAEIAALAAGGRSDTAALRNQLTEAQIQTERDKQAAKAKETSDTETAKSEARSTIAALANDLASDSSLSDITGMLEGRRESFLLPGNAEAMRKYNELVNKIALERRGDLKGQGTISNYEAQQVIKAIGLDRTVGTDNLKKKILEIAKQYGAGAPEATVAGAPARKRYDINGNLIP